MHQYWTLEVPVGFVHFAPELEQTLDVVWNATFGPRQVVELSYGSCLASRTIYHIHIANKIVAR